MQISVNVVPLCVCSGVVLEGWGSTPGLYYDGGEGKDEARLAPPTQAFVYELVRETFQPRIRSCQTN